MLSGNLNCPQTPPYLALPRIHSAISPFSQDNREAGCPAPRHVVIPHGYLGRGVTKKLRSFFTVHLLGKYPASGFYHAPPLLRYTTGSLRSGLPPLRELGTPRGLEPRGVSLTSPATVAQANMGCRILRMPSGGKYRMEESERRMEWTLGPSSITYKCAHCSWYLHLLTQDYSRAREQFDRHNCAGNSPILSLPK
jgi:hypothetical protein